MRSVSAEFKKSIKQPSRRISSRIEFSNFNIIDEDIISININESVLSSEKFELGGAIATSIDVEISNFKGTYAEALFKDKEFNLYMGIELKNSSIEEIQLGTYKVFEPTTSGKTIKLECYDKFIDMDKDYDTTLQYPMPVHNIIVDISQVFNIELSEKLKAGDYYNNDFVIQGKPTDITYRQVLHDIAVVLGGFAVIRNGVLDIIDVSETDLEINTKNSFKSPSITRTFDQITMVDLNGTFKGTLEGNKLELDVPLLDYNSTTDIGAIAEYILEKYKDFVYTGFSSEWQGDFSTEVCDSIKVTDTNNKSYSSFISGNKLSYSGGLKATTESKIDKEQIKTANREYQKLQSQIKEVESGIYYFTNNNKATVNSILTQFAYIGFALSGSANLILHVAINIEGSGTVECQLLLDSKIMKFAPKQYINLNGVLSFSIPLIQLTGDKHNLAVMLKASSDMTINPEQGQITIFGHNLAGALSDEYPHAELYEKLEYKDFNANAEINHEAITMLIDDINVNVSEEIKYSNDIENTISDSVKITLE